MSELELATGSNAPYNDIRNNYSIINVGVWHLLTPLCFCEMSKRKTCYCSSMGNGSSSNKQKIEKSFICKPRQNVKLHYNCFDVRCMIVKIR